MEIFNSLDVNEIARFCMEIHNNPENFKKQRSVLVNKLLELPDKEVHNYPYHAVCGGAKGLRNFALMALISLYRLNVDKKIPNSLDIIKFYSQFNNMYFDNIFLVPKFKETLKKFIVEDLKGDYSNKIFFIITEHIHSFIKFKHESQTELILWYLRLIKEWYLSTERDLKVDINWYFLRELFQSSYSYVHKEFIDLLVNLLKNGVYNVISFYSYIIRYVRDKEQRIYFKKNLPNSSEIDGIDNFIIAERAYGNKDYEKALKYYENLPSGFPFIHSLRHYKLFYSAIRSNNHSKICFYFKEYVKDLNLLKKLSNMIFTKTELERWKQEYFQQYFKSSEILKIINGIQCSFCSKFNSPNTIFCSKCGESIKHNRMRL